MRSLLCVLSVAIAPVPTVAAQHVAPVTYVVRFPNAAHHEAEITVTFRGLPRTPLQLRMSRSSPGRYAIHEFGKNIYQVRAADSRGRSLTVTRPDPYQWDVGGHDGTVVVSYTLYADRTDGTYSAIDRTHAHLNAPATFLWARGLERRPVRVTFRDLPEGWAVATQLAPTDDPLTFAARDFQYFMDSPIEVSDFDLRTWTVSSGGREQTIRLAVHHDGTAAEVDSFAVWTAKVVREQAGVFGELPRFDHGTYTFLADYLPWASGDGMEHRNSTVLTSSQSLRSGALGNLGTVSHEFVHIWNVERIRPRALEPFHFERANMSGELWLAEGFTSYYGPLTIHRAGIVTVSQYARGLSGGVNAIVNGTGRRYFSPREMSMQAPFVDAATALDPTNFANTFISYYTWGAAIGLALDLAIRERHPDRSLDTYMQELWRAHGVAERPYTNDDARRALGRVTDTAFANDFWRRYIDGRESPDFGRLLAQAGFLVRSAAAGQPWIGPLPLQVQDGQVVVMANTIVGTPLYEAGVDRGDRLVSIDGRSISATGDVQAAIAARRPGDRIPLTFVSRGRTVEAHLTVAEAPTLEVVPFEEAHREVTPAMRAFRESWLGSKAIP